MLCHNQSRGRDRAATYLANLLAQVHDCGHSLGRGVLAVDVLQQAHDVSGGKKVSPHHPLWTLGGAGDLQAQV